MHLNFVSRPVEKVAILLHTLVFVHDSLTRFLNIPHRCIFNTFWSIQGKLANFVFTKVYASNKMAFFQEGMTQYKDTTIHALGFGGLNQKRCCINR